MFSVHAQLEKTQAALVSTRTWLFQTDLEQYDRLKQSTSIQYKQRYYLDYKLHPTKPNPEEPIPAPIPIFHYLDWNHTKEQGLLASQGQFSVNTYGYIEHLASQETIRHMQQCITARDVLKGWNPMIKVTQNRLQQLAASIPSLLFYGNYHEDIFKTPDHEYSLKFPVTKDQSNLVLLSTKANMRATLYLFPEELDNLEYQDVTNDDRYLLHNLLR